VRWVRLALAAIDGGAPPRVDRWTPDDPIAYGSAERAERESKPRFLGAFSSSWQRRMDRLLGVVDRDFTIGEGVRRTFETGLLRSVAYGRREPALEHFHRSIREALEEAR
jgi:hypothetical protein